jgi:hypothetical protein
MIISHQIKNGYNSLVPISGGTATAFSAFKVSAKNGLFSIWTVSLIQPF